MNPSFQSLAYAIFWCNAWNEDDTPSRDNHQIHIRIHDISMEFFLILDKICKKMPNTICTLGGISTSNNYKSPDSLKNTHIFQFVWLNMFCFLNSKISIIDFFSRWMTFLLRTSIKYKWYFVLCYFTEKFKSTQSMWQFRFPLRFFKFNFKK